MKDCAMRKHNKKMDVFTASVNEFCGNVRYGGATCVRYDNASLRNASETAAGDGNKRRLEMRDRGRVGKAAEERLMSP